MGMAPSWHSLSLFIARFIAAVLYHLFRMQTSGARRRWLKNLSVKKIASSLQCSDAFHRNLSRSMANYAGYSQEAIFYSPLPILRRALSMPHLCLWRIWCLRILSEKSLLLSVGDLSQPWSISILNPLMTLPLSFAELYALACAERLYSILGPRGSERQ